MCRGIVLGQRRQAIGRLFSGGFVQLGRAGNPVVGGIVLLVVDGLRDGILIADFDRSAGTFDALRACPRLAHFESHHPRQDILGTESFLGHAQGFCLPGQLIGQVELAGGQGGLGLAGQLQRLQLDVGGTRSDGSLGSLRAAAAGFSAGGGRVRP